jgi:VIT1/CCC1 family predicted Fe2+/Mn2+ transporter
LLIGALCAQRRACARNQARESEPNGLVGGGVRGGTFGPDMYDVIADPATLSAGRESRAPGAVGAFGRIEAAALREILMGAQDNLTNVLAVTLGVAIGAGRSDLVALAGLSAAVAEAVSMGGVLYSATRAEQLRSDPGRRGPRLAPVASGLTTMVAALIAGLVPLLPFAFLPLSSAVVATMLISVSALFALGSWTGRIGGASWWRDGLRLLLVGGAAAMASAGVGLFLRVE